MQNEELIWQTINYTFCSFKSKIETTTFCKNQYNVTGLCNRSSCPLANSRYATIIEKEGVCYLYMKTIERAHTPNRLWEIVKLSKNYEEALQQINDNLQYWPNFLKHKCKQRLTKIRQYLQRMRNLKKNGTGKQIVTINKKRERREVIREDKALKMANLEKKIKSELLDRLKKGVYDDDIVNIDHEFNDLLEEEGEEDVEEEDDVEEGEEDAFVEDLSDDMEDFEFENETEGGQDLLDDDDEEEGDEDDEDEPPSDDEEDAPTKKKKRMEPKAAPVKKPAPTKKAPKKGGKKGGAKVRIEYEDEPVSTSHTTDW
eukprot:TRINITY_DN5272_c0_g1_i1.p1 TRINITY_DN5272_c0_g1~~TRINITY_DN5272_c0_g1_i1.p1  ORF type:complete len:314 (-),score=117.45 TRINITY_DN5272_c0_g1_i1:36-977(-)